LALSRQKTEKFRFFRFFDILKLMKNLQKFFNPKSIAIVGASPKKEKLGNVFARNVLNGGWKGKLYFVNPKHKKIGSQKCYPSLDAIKKPVDLALIVVPAPLVPRVLEEGTKAKPKIENFAVVSAGFGETGAEGKKLEESVKTLAENERLNVLGPNCLGFIHPAQRLNLTFTDGRFKKGGIAVVSQSGALAVALLDWMQNSSVGFSKVISIGNKAVIDECDVLEHLSSDKETRAVALYLEDIKDGQKFAETAAKLAEKKPLIVLKAGKTRAGQKAVSSHTGSLAQDSAIAEAVFEKTNIIEAKTIEEFQNLILFASFSNIPEKNEIIIITNAGGPGVLASDFIGSSNVLKLASISEKAKVELKKSLPASASVENPIDVIGDAAPDRFAKTLETVSRYFPKNPVLVVLTPQSQSAPEKVAQILKKFKAKIPHIAAAFIGGEKVRKANEFLRQNGIPAFENPEEAMATVEKTVAYALYKNKKISAYFPKNIRLDIQVNKIIQSALGEKRKMLSWREAEQIFKKHGIKIEKSASFKKLSEINVKKIAFPCVLKTDDPKIIHRWDKKAIVLGIKNEKELKSAFGKIKKSTGARSFLLQPMAKPGLEMIFGLKRDPSFGPVIVAGWGGTFTEIFKDRALFVSPFSADEVKRGLQKLDIFPILKGFRGERGYDIGEIVKTMLAIQEIAIRNPDISEIDVNPAILYNNGSKCRILDAKIIF
jgi:acetyltransferase